jgi:hypothetical protein
MRVFLIAAAAALVLATTADFTLKTVQETAPEAYHTSAARLDQQESINDYGRSG